MKFVFVDEAGIPHHSKRSSANFTLAGMVVDERSLLTMEENLRFLKRKNGLHPFQEFKWNTSYSRLNLSFEKYIEIRRGVFDLIHSHSETVVATVLRKQQAFKKPYINSEYDLYKQALTLLMERINYHYQEDKEEFPVVFVIDSRNSKEDDKLRHAYRDATRVGTFYANFDRFSETPFFVESSHSAGLQLADFCAGPIQQYFETGKDDWYNILYPKIRKCPWGKVMGCGIKIFP